MTFFLESKFTLLVVILVLSSTTILASLFLRALVFVLVDGGGGDEVFIYLSLILRHSGSFSWLGLPYVGSCLWCFECS